MGGGNNLAQNQLLVQCFTTLSSIVTMILRSKEQSNLRILGVTPVSASRAITPFLDAVSKAQRKSSKTMYKVPFLQRSAPSIFKSNLCQAVSVDLPSRKPCCSGGHTPPGSRIVEIALPFWDSDYISLSPFLRYRTCLKTTIK